MSRNFSVSVPQAMTAQQLLLSEGSAGLGNESDVDSESGYKEQDVILM